MCIHENVSHYFMQLTYNDILNQGSEFHFGKKYKHKGGTSSVCSDTTSPVFCQAEALLTHCLQEESLTQNMEIEDK